MAKNVIELDEIELAIIKKKLRSQMKPCNNQDCVEFAMKVAVNCVKYLDEDTYDIVKP